ncbi:MAG TPA: AraC family transcriptional regulator [Panacibacter sp.]|nr:AraC family transcriptional regulator [Panacibacter sp.]
MNLYFNPRSAILLAIFIQAVVTAFLLFKRGAKGNKQSDKFLSALIFFLGLSLTDFVIGFLGFYEKYPKLVFFPFENLFLITALIYLFCVSLLKKDKPENKIIGKHLFIPAVYFLSHFIIFLLPNSTKQKILTDFYFTFFVYIESLLFYVLSAYYFVHIIKVLKRHTEIANQAYPQINPAILNWLRYFVIGFIIYLTIDFILSVSSVLFHFNFEQQYWKYIVRALLTSFLCLAGYNFDEKVSLPNIEFQKTETENEQKSELINEKELIFIKEKILSIFQKDKLYLEPELDLNQLSKQLGISSNILSYVINKGFEKNFNDFINTYRINEVIEKMKNPANVNFTLLSIAFDCGFNSKTTFNRVFKKVTQKSPKQFWEEIKAIS